jgi:CubicO group peptidase (beta-lactamase class C family)
VSHALATLASLGTLAVGAVGCARAAARTDAPPHDQRGAWLQYAAPADAGFSAAALDAVRRHADSVRAAAVVAVYGGRVLAAWGAVDRNLPAQSVRKSMAGALYGIAAEEGRFPLDRTLRELGVDDEPPLADAERGARLADLLASRSGVYHDAAYADAGQRDGRPARGSNAPGAVFYYNNWDFNALEGIYARLTGEDVLAAFGRVVARPLGMEDYDPSLGLVVREPSRSRFAAHVFRISARDLARFGQLYLQRGRWNGRQLVPERWVRESTTPRSDLGDGAGYGLLWWTYAAGAAGSAYPNLRSHTLYLARGTGGHALFVIPTLDLVVVHRPDTDNGRVVPGPAVWRIVDGIAGARTGSPAASPRLVPMRPAPFASQLPAPPEPRVVSVAPATIAGLVGEYELSPTATIRLFADSGRLFIDVPGEGEAELFATSDSTFVVRAQPGVSVAFRRDAGGRATEVVGQIGPRRLVARRR